MRGAHLVGHGNGEASLADSAGTGQGQQAHIVAVDEGSDLVDFLFAGEQGGQRERKPSRTSGGLLGASDDGLVGLFCRFMNLDPGVRDAGPPA